MTTEPFENESEQERIREKAHVYVGERERERVSGRYSMRKGSSIVIDAVTINSRGK